MVSSSTAVPIRPWARRSRPRAAAVGVLLAAALSVGLLPSVAFASHNDGRVDPCASTPAALELLDRALARQVHVTSIDCVYNRRITVGSVDAGGNRLYEPAPQVTRGQMASFISRTLVAGGYDAELPAGGGGPEFSDVASSTHREAVNRLARAGIVRGTSPGRYEPEAPVSRQQMAAFMVRAARFALGDAHPIVRDAADRFGDVPATSVHKADIEAGADAAPALFQGVARSAFQPATPVQRDQMATFLVNLLRSIFRVATAPPPIVPPPGPTPTAVPSPSLSPQPTVGPGPSPTSSPSAGPEPSPGPSPSGSPEPSPTASPDPSVSPSPTPSPSTSEGPGPGLVTVPDVVAVQQGSALTRIVAATLAVGDVRFVRSPTATAGTVLDQEPDAGTRVPAGSPVALQVSTGDELRTVPDVVGRTQAAAEDAIEQAGFSVGAVRDTTSDDVDAGEVDRQLPLAGKQALPGTPVDVDVARGTVNDPPRITSTPGLRHTTGGAAYAYTAVATDADGDALSWVLQAGPDGAVLDARSGELTWPARADQAGPHDLVLRVEDGRGGIDTQSATLTVAVPNRPPDADDDVLSATTGQKRSIEAAELFANDSDPEGAPLTIASFTQPQTGTVAREGDGLVYTPNDPQSTDVRTDVELTHALPATLTSDRTTNTAYPLARLLDDYRNTDWFPTSSQRVPVTLRFAFEADVAVRRVDLAGARTFGEQGYDVRRLDIRVLDGAGAQLLRVDDLTMPDPDPALDADTHDPDASFDLTQRNGGAPVTGARTVEVIIQQVGPKLYPGLSEVDIWGDGVPTRFRPKAAWSDPTSSSYSSPVVADLDQDGVGSVVATVVTPGVGARLRVYDGATGEVEWSRTDASSDIPAALGDVADCVVGADPACRDDDVEVVYVDEFALGLRIADARGRAVGQVGLRTDVNEDPPALVDVEGDGDVEVVIGNSELHVVDIDRASGAMTERYRTSAAGSCGNNTYRTCIPVAADVDVDGDVEIVTGNRLFDAATGAVEQRGQNLPDAFVGVANLDDDPEGEIVRVHNGTLHVVNHDFTTVFGPILLASPEGLDARGGGGPPTIADFDGDGRPEVGIAGASVYAVYDPDMLTDADPANDSGVLWKAPIVDASSSRTGSTLFDFDDDGRAEVVYSSEQNLHIWDGATGAELWRRPMSSGTTIEHPVVADVDGNGEAEIVVNLVSGRAENDISHPGGVTVLESPARNWVRARGIWNQNTYSVTNVGSDGSIPRVAEVNWLTGGLNNLRQQAFPPDDPSRLDRFSYRVSDGDQTSGPATVFVEARPPQNAPVITCGPPATATIGFPYRGRICADDPDGDALTWAGAAGASSSVTVDGDARPWLADQPEGTALGASPQDVAPAQSPALVSPGVVLPGTELRFRVAGQVTYSGSTAYPADGYRDGSGNPQIVRHALGDEFGIADLQAPGGSLVGVFLDDSRPGAGTEAPAALDYSTTPSRNALTQAPQLRQPFYVGDGRTRDGQEQRVTVPPGATRLFLGVMDNTRYNDNTGGFQVTVGAGIDSGLVLDPASGRVTWTPTSTGSYRLDATVTDDGVPPRTVATTYPIEVLRPAAVPSVAGLDEAAARTEIAAERLVVGPVQRVSSSTVPAGQVVEQFPPPGSAAAVDSRVTLVVSDGPSPGDRDADGDGHTPNQGDCNDGDARVHPGAAETANDGVDSDCDGEDGGLDVEQIGINGSDAKLVVGRTRSYTAQALLSDGRVVDVTELATFAVADGAVAAVDRRTVTATGVGSTTVTATFSGITASKGLEVINGLPADDLAPVADISAPVPGAEVATTVDVVGTATDANLTGWSLKAVDGRGEVLDEIAAGTVAVEDGVLGTFDTASVSPGLVSLRLDVADAGGNISRVDVPVQVLEGPQVGVFTLSFTDLVVPVAGIPLSVLRTYDSRESRVGDFGAGWDLALTGLDLTVTPDQGVGWDLAPGRFGSTSLVPSTEHAVTVVTPDGVPQVFDLAPSPSAATFAPLTFTQARYVPRPGTRGTLRPLGNTNLLVLASADGVELVDDGDLRSYEPSGYVYTAADGTRFELDRDGTVTRVTDPNGNTITISRDGITHSAGRSVAFERDALDRITAITDPEGNRQTYRYDGRGDLTTHTDAEGHTTRYRYTGAHDLFEIIDPLGRVVDRREYDDAGRLIAITDATGNRLSLEHDLAGRREVLTDANGNATVLTYDERGSILQSLDALGGKTLFTYDAHGNRLTTTDPLDRTTTRTFNAAGDVLTERDAGGREVAYAYDAAGRVTSVVDPLGTTTYTYDSRGNLLSTTDPSGGVERRSYDARGNLVSLTDAAGATTTYAYNPAGLLVSETGPDGATATTAYDDAGTVLRLTSPSGLASSFENNRNGAPVAVITPTGDRSTVTYTPGGELSAVVDAAGNRTEQEMDAAGRVLSTTDATGAVSRFTYTRSGQVATRTDAAGAVTTFEYDALDRLTRTLAPSGTQTVRYDAAGQVLGVDDGRGQTRFAYDRAGRVVSETDPTGRTTGYEYDAAGNVTARIDALGVRTGFAYDDLGRPAGTIFPDGSSVSSQYDAAGTVVATTDRAGRTTRLRHDAAGNLVEVADPAGGRTSATYDADGRLLSITDAIGQTSRTRYDGNGRPVSTIRPGGATERIAYDEAGNPERVTDANGNLTTRTFDEVGRPLTVTYGDGTATALDYSDAGRLTAVTDARGTTGYAYDVAGRLLGVDLPDQAAIDYGYDAHGLLGSVATTTPDGASRQTGYGYDAAGRLTLVEDSAGRSASYAYDDVGRLAAIALPGGTRTTVDYDLLGQPTVVAHRRGPEVLQQSTYTRDASGDVTRITEADGAGSTFDYDVLRRLVAENHTDAAGAVSDARNYTYDAVGNRLTETDAAGRTTTSTYGPGDRLLTAGSASATYDAAGNQLSWTDEAGTTLYGYDARGLMTNVSVPEAGTISYAYDHHGNRVRSGATNALVDPLALTGAPEVVAEYDAGGAATAWRTFGRELLSQERAGVFSVVHGDASGSTRLLTDGAGQVTDTVRYLAFGEQLSRTGSTAIDHLFAGQQLDTGSGLYHLRARQYAPDTGRLTAVDPFEGLLSDPVTRHPYQYARNNPLTFEDPSGLLALPTLGQLATTISIQASIGAIIGKATGDGFVKGAIFGAFSGLAGGIAGTAITAGAFAGVMRVAGPQVFATLASNGRMSLAIGFAKGVGEGTITLLDEGFTQNKKIDGPTIAATYTVSIILEVAFRDQKLGKGVEDALVARSRQFFEYIATENLYIQMAKRFRGIAGATDAQYVIDSVARYASPSEVANIFLVAVEDLDPLSTALRSSILGVSDIGREIFKKLAALAPRLITGTR